MDLLLALIMGLRIATLGFFAWYLAERCCAAYDARNARKRRRVQFQSIWRSSTVYGDEMDYIITRKDEPIEWKK